MHVLRVRLHDARGDERPAAWAAAHTQAPTRIRWGGLRGAEAGYRVEQGRAEAQFMRDTGLHAYTHALRMGHHA